MWIESHGNLARHPKTRRLMQRMGWTLPFTIGNLHLLWWWALDFAPDGNLTHFDPDQITADLDLDGATPEQFLEAMIEAGFLDRLSADSIDSRPDGNNVTPESRPGGNGSICIHDWVDYTSRSSRSKSRKSISSLGSNEMSSTVSEPASSCALRSDQMVGMALRAVPRINTSGPVDDTAQSDFTPDTTTHNVDASSASETAERDSASNAEPTELPIAIPEVLASMPSFTDLLWPRFLDIHKTSGDPLNAAQQRRLLARLAMVPFSAVQKLKASIGNPLNTSAWKELLENTS